MTTDELLARIDTTVRLTVAMPAWRRFDGQVVYGTEGIALTERERREWAESQVAA